MNWTTDTPTKPGWYWWRNLIRNQGPLVVEVWADEQGHLKSGRPPTLSKEALMYRATSGRSGRGNDHRGRLIASSGSLRGGLCLLLGSRFPTDDAVIVSGQKAGVGPFQFQIQDAHKQVDYPAVATLLAMPPLALPSLGLFRVSLPGPQAHDV